ncbi:MAG: hypothetical protein JWP11_1294 [Frankiales bacterium]|nr:hypothetical protein [Frankiales bacterium]
MPARSRALGPRGRKLWSQLHAGGKVFDPLADLLAEEACRIADRLEQLDAILTGRSAEWITFREVDDGGREVQVVVDGALAEARQQATALKGLIAQLEKARPPAEPEKPKASATNDIQRRRAERLAARPGS